jgi:hypothetical protein
MLRRLFQAAAVLLAASAVAAPPAEAQRVDPNRIIELHVNAEADNRAFDIATLEGRRSRMTFAGNGTYEISPIVLDRAGRRFRLTIYKGAENAPSEQLRQVEQVEAQLGVPVAIRSMPTVSVVVDGTRRRPTAAGQVPSQFQFASLSTQVRRSLATFSGDCCVTCGTVTACGCAVAGMSCGSCCSDACCPPPEEEEKKPPPGGVVLFHAPRSFEQMVGRCGKQVKDEERILTPRATTRTAMVSR